LKLINLVFLAVERSPVLEIDNHRDAPRTNHDFHLPELSSVQKNLLIPDIVANQKG